MIPRSKAVPSMECEVFRSIRLRVLSDRSRRTSVFKIVLPVFGPPFLFPLFPRTFSFSLCESFTEGDSLKQIQLHLSRYRVIRVLKLQYDFDNHDRIRGRF